MTFALTYGLQAQSRYLLGDPVIIGFTLKNGSTADLWVLKWYTPLEGIKGRILTVRCDGVEIPYNGRLVKRGEPQSDDYVLLRGGSSVQNGFDLAPLYSLVPCDECRVSFRGRIHDIATDKNDVPRASSEHGEMQISGNDVVFSILPRK